MLRREGAPAPAGGGAVAAVAPAAAAAPAPHPCWRELRLPAGDAVYTSLLTGALAARVPAPVRVCRRPRVGPAGAPEA